MNVNTDLSTLVDVLIPGDDRFPAASAVGAHGLLAERLRERVGIEAVADVLTSLQVATDGAVLTDLGEAERVAAVEQFEQDAPELFAAVRNILYFSYYQSPLVVAAIRDLGLPYNDAPQPLGYAMEPFDSTPGGDAPDNPRGRYVATDAVTQVRDLPGAAVASGSEP